MSRPLSRVLRESTIEGVKRWGFWCPGCRHPHMLPLTVPHASVNKGVGPWYFEGDLEAPSIKPSIHITYGELKDPDTGAVLAPAGSWCHCIVTNGIVHFLEDSHGHTLRGAHPLPPFPHPELEAPLPKQDPPKAAARVPERVKVWRTVR